ncbi:MAG: hypothetical protein NDJ94_00990 [Vicinamibacteria bacterium]|jgi:hypothetical protein|nr:hypothetical protein [Vicinamibacteria bacterium]
MTAKSPQSFANHARFVPLFHVGVFGAFVLNVLFQAYRLYLAPRPSQEAHPRLAAGPPAGVSR